MGCDTCPFKGRTKVPYEGKATAEIVIIGEAPAKEEIKEGRPFVGRSGKLLDKLLEHINIERENIAILNSLKCKLNKEKDSLKDIGKALACCKDYIDKALLKTQPRLIICLGAIALRQMLKKQKMLENRGQFFPYKTDVIDSIIFATVHPAYILRGASKNFPDKPIDLMSMKEKLLFNDFHTVKGFILNDFKQVEIDTSGYAKTDILDTGNKNLVAFDYETNTLNPLRPDAKILSIAISIEEKKSSVLLSPKKEDIKEFLENEDIMKIVAARPFEENFSKQILGTTVKGKIRDVLTMAHVLDENFYEYTLEAVTNNYTDLKDIKSLAKGFRFNLQDAPEETLVGYNGVDSDATLRGYNVMKVELKKHPKLANYYLNFICLIQDMFADINMNGCLIDKDKLRENEQFTIKELDRLHTECINNLPETIIEKHKNKGLKLTRADLIIDYLFTHEDGLKLKPEIFTEKTNEPATSEEHIKLFKDLPWIQKYIEWKKLDKIHGNYITNLWGYIREDGRIYPNTLLILTVTGRTVMLDPPMQVYPIRSKYSYILRQPIVADEDWYFGSRDLSQSQMRIVGWLAKDPNILRALDSKIDLHSRTAKEILGIDNITEETRRAAKAVNFGFIFGMGAEGFRTHAKNKYDVNFTLEECITYRESYFAEPFGYYRLPSYHNRQKALVVANGYVESPLGRRRRLPDIYNEDWALRSRAERQAINFPVQSFDSDLGLIGMYMFWKELKMNLNLKDKVKIMWFIHDSVLFQAHKNVFKEAMSLLKYCMETKSKEYIKNNFGIDVTYPINSDGKYGVNWSDMKEFKDERS